MQATSWKAFLLQLSQDTKTPLLLEWQMENGAEFQWLLPDPNEFGQRAFISENECSLKYDEIEEIRSVHHVPGFTLPENIIEYLRKSVSNYGDLTLLELENGGFVIQLQHKSQWG